MNHSEDEVAGEECDRTFYPVSYRVLNLWARERSFIQNRSVRERERLTDNPSNSLDNYPAKQKSSHQSSSKKVEQREALHER